MEHMRWMYIWAAQKQSMYKITLFFILVACIVASTLSWSVGNDEVFHTDIELQYFRSAMTHDSSLVDGWNTIFAAAGECNGCHGKDDSGYASHDAEGNDINVVDDWRATMMAMAAKDPFWRAKVSHEVLVTPGLQLEIESSCTDCHAPMGFYNAMHLGIPHYSMADLKMDSVALDGISCGACHQIKPDSIGLTFSGMGIKYVEDTIYGPYQDPFAGPMQSFVGFMPVYSEHMAKSQACATCHTLITETIGIDGLLNGQEVVEQATYHEWVNSAYNADDESAIQCQGCHMTRVDDNIVIASNLLFLEPRSPFFRHDLVGGNTFMLDMMKENRDTLDLRASAEQIDRIRERTLNMLQQETLDILCTQQLRNADSLFVDVELTNKAGHKFPSGYPSRIAYVQFIAINEEGDTLFKSGMLDSSYELIERDPEFEEHYDMINAESKVQIYELVMADETDAETTVLSQADHILKDNRLAPLGFTDTHFAYDTTTFYGAVLNDDDFNKEASGVQGTGKDKISYHIPTYGYDGTVEVKVKVYYQVTPPRWLASMFDHTSEDIDLFRWMYENSDKEPILIASDSLMSLASGMEDIVLRQDIIVFPNPTYGREIAISNRAGYSIDSYTIYDVSGRVIKVVERARGNTVYAILPETKGIYFIQISSRGSQVTKQVLKL